MGKDTFLYERSPIGKRLLKGNIEERNPGGGRREPHARCPARQRLSFWRRALKGWSLKYLPKASREKKSLAGKEVEGVVSRP